MWHIIKLKLATENVWLRIFDSLLSVHLDVPRVYRIYYADLRHSMKFLSLRRRCSSWQNVPSSEEQGETAVFPGFTFKQCLQKIGLYLLLGIKSRDVSCTLCSVGGELLTYGKRQGTWQSKT